MENKSFKETLFNKINSLSPEDKKLLERIYKINTIKGKLVIALEQSDDLASFYANQWLLKNETLTPEEKLRLVDKVTISDINKIAKEIFVPEKLNLAVIGPIEESEKERYKLLLKL